MTETNLIDDRPHDEAEALLPWYATGQIEAADRALVERHLESCERCQRQVAIERRLIDEFRAFDPAVDSGWARLRGRLDAPAGRKRAPAIGPLVAEYWNRFSRPALVSLAVAQLAFVVVAGGLLLSLNHTSYQGLSTPPQRSAANLLVMFTQGSSEADLRRLLRSNGATFVGGPTEAGAYLLHVPANGRPQAVAALRSDPHVTMAEPIDGDRR